MITCKSCRRDIPTVQSFSVSGKVPVRSECECGAELRAIGGLAEESELHRRSHHERLMRRLRG